MVIFCAIIILIYSIGQIALAVMVLTGKFDPLLPKERKNLPAKVRKQARALNAVAMIATSLVFCAVSVGLLFNLDYLLKIAATMFGVVVVIILFLGIKIEGKYFKNKKSH